MALSPSLVSVGGSRPLTVAALDLSSSSYVFPPLTPVFTYLSALPNPDYYSISCSGFI